MNHVWLHHPDLPDGQDIKVPRDALGTYAASGWQIRPDQSDPVDPDLTVDDDPVADTATTTDAFSTTPIDDDDPTMEDR
ncbi:MAG: hypothetical protein L0K86_11870 [Actinomycetia bacterium]|nr:hypothetical protein [Actinomycetes bacterium]